MLAVVMGSAVATALLVPAAAQASVGRNPGHLALNPPSGALPILHSGPAVELITLKKISVTVSVITPMYTSDKRP